MVNSISEKPRFFSSVGRMGSKIFLNKYFLLLLFCGACTVSALGKEVMGAFIFLSVICLALVFCDDIMAMALPLLLMSVFLTKCYDSSSIFMPYVWLVAPVVACILFHFIVYRQRFSVGHSFFGLCAVAIAITMGGISWASGYEYFTATALYYTFFLGLGMVGIYLLFKSQLTMKRDYDVKELMVKLLYITGIFASFMVLLNILPNITFGEGFKLYTEFQPANNLSTFLTFALPCPFFFVPKNKLHLFSAVLMLGCMCISGSRSGLIIGIAEFFLCLIVCALWDRPRRFFYVCATIASVAAALLLKDKVLGILEASKMYPFVTDNENRLVLIERAFDMLSPDKNPIFGHGLGYHGNFDIYKPKSGAIGWYHMMIPQIVGSLGLVGIAAYLYQAVMHIKVAVTAIKKSVFEETGLVATLVMSYVGVLMMSQINPGLFCPIPYGVIATVIFAAIDGDGAFEGIARGISSLAEKIKKKKTAEEETEEVAEVIEEPVEEVVEDTRFQRSNT